MTSTLLILGVFFLLAIPVLVGRLLIGATRELLRDEIRAWIPHLSRHLARQAVLSMAEDQRDILEDLESRLEGFSDRPIAMLIEAINIWRDRKLMAQEAATPVLEPSPGSRQSGRRTVSLPGAAAAVGSVAYAKRVLAAILLRVGRWSDRLDRRTCLAVVMGLSMPISVTSIVTYVSTGNQDYQWLSVAIAGAVLVVWFFVRRPRR